MFFSIELVMFISLARCGYYIDTNKMTLLTHHSLRLRYKVNSRSPSLKPAFQILKDKNAVRRTTMIIQGFYKIYDRS